MQTKEKGILSSIFQMKCPKCRKGNMFCTPNIFPLKDLLKMPERCTTCSQKMEIEVGFYYGTGYVSYALTLLILALVFVFYGLFFGLSYKNNSVFIALGIAISLVVLLQPWLMRISRVLYLYLFVKYDQQASKE